MTKLSLKVNCRISFGVSTLYILAVKIIILFENLFANAMRS